MTEIVCAGKRWAVLMGINGYHESLGPLRFCVRDAKLMQKALVSEHCGFPAANVLTLTDEEAPDRQPTFGNIHKWLGAWLARPGPDDLVLVYFAGHGRELRGASFLAPSDATLETLHVTGIGIDYVRQLLERCNAKQKILLLDACHSGAGRDVSPMSVQFRRALPSGRGLFTIASSDADQLSHEWPEKGHGVFTYHLVHALQFAPASSAHGGATIDDVYDYTRRAVLDWSAEHAVRQEPLRICSAAGSIAIAQRRVSPEQRVAAAEAEAARLRDILEHANARVDALERENKKLSDTMRKIPDLERTIQLLRDERDGLRGILAELQTKDDETPLFKLDPGFDRAIRWLLRRWAFSSSALVLLLATPVLIAWLRSVWNKATVTPDSWQGWHLPWLFLLVPAVAFAIGCLGYYGCQWQRSVAATIGLIVAVLMLLIGMIASLFGSVTLTTVPLLSLFLLISQRDILLLRGGVRSQ